MKPIHPQLEDRSASHQTYATTIHPLHEDEAHQEQMRRLHNARARRRAAQQHRTIQVQRVH